MRFTPKFHKKFVKFVILYFPVIPLLLNLKTPRFCNFLVLILFQKITYSPPTEQKPNIINAKDTLTKRPVLHLNML